MTLTINNAIFAAFLSDWQQKNAALQQSARVSFTLPMEHAHDRDCQIDPETRLCQVCGVEHGAPCPVCGGRGFHANGCSSKR